MGGEGHRRNKMRIVRLARTQANNVSCGGYDEATCIGKPRVKAVSAVNIASNGSFLRKVQSRPGHRMLAL
jgi:hypothetical protein